jgi:hypothetical protein
MRCLLEEIADLPICSKAEAPPLAYDFDVL